jgi:hypothetical protein
MVYWADAPTGPWVAGAIAGDNSRLYIPPHATAGEVYLYMETYCSPGPSSDSARLPFDPGVLFAYRVQ